MVEVLIMRGIVAVVTYNCNAMCSICKYKCAPYKKGIMDAAEFQSRVKEAYNEGYRDYLTIQGGEVFLHTGIIFKYLKKINDLSIKKQIVTNGFWGFMDPYVDILQDLKKLGVEHIILEYDYFHSLFIEKETVLKSIDRCIRSKLNISIKSMFETQGIQTEADMKTFELIKYIKNKYNNLNFIFEVSNNQIKDKPNEKVILYQTRQSCIHC
jgi:MoaA/NifB/PqqE/SkfB family radical SAM enzyme